MADRGKEKGLATSYEHALFGANRLKQRDMEVKGLPWNVDFIDLVFL